MTPLPKKRTEDESIGERLGFKRRSLMKRLGVIASIFLGSGTATASGTGSDGKADEDQEDLTLQEKKDHVRRVETAVNAQDHDALSEIFAENVSIHLHGGRKEINGLDEFEAYLTEIYTAFPDITFTFETVIGEEDLVGVRYSGTGTHTGEFNGIAPTGNEVRLSGMRFVELESGKIAEVWGHQDDLGLLVQLGAVEPPGN